jgi:DNA repair protein RadC
MSSHIYRGKESVAMEHVHRRDNPPTIDAPGIQDLEFSTRLDPETGGLHVVRDAAYRGDDADFPQVRSSDDAFAMLRGMGTLPEENIALLLLDANDRVFGLQPKHKGHLDSVEASLRQIVVAAVLSGRAKSIIFAHNHPSGDPGPSPDDEKLTHAVERIAARLGICVLDHLVIGRPSTTHPEFHSFRDAGTLLNPELEPEVDDAPPPPPIRTNGISDLEFVVDRDDESGSLMPIRDGDYRGDVGQKPEASDTNDLVELFPEIGHDGTVAVLLDTRQQIIGWTAWGDACGETPGRLVRRAVIPPLMMNARSVALLRRTGSAKPSRRDDALTQELSEVFGELDIEFFDHVLLGDDSVYSYRDAGRLTDKGAT